MSRSESIDFEELLKQHRQWLDSDGKSGKRAELQHRDLSGLARPGAGLVRANLAGTNLSGANLAGAFFAEADLSGAQLIGADLRGSHLESANLLGADLRGANLERAWFNNNTKLTGANLHRANLRAAVLGHADALGVTLREADLRDCDLTETQGLSASQLVGADLSNAKLPEPIGNFDELRRLDDASKAARKLFVILLLSCAYLWLAVAQTTDARLLTNSPSSPLPIIATAVPIVWVYTVAPVLLLAIYIYFHLHLQRLWEGFAALPAFFPDGRSLDRCAYPWLLNGLISRQMYRLRGARPALARLQSFLAIVLAWWLTPVTIVWFWFRYLSRQDWTVTVWHIVVCVLAICVAVLFQRLEVVTLRGEGSRRLLSKKILSDGRLYVRSAIVAATASSLTLISFGVVEGIGAPGKDSIWWLLLQGGTRPVSESWQTILRRLIPQALERVRYYPFADLVDAEVSTKPENWRGDSREDDLRVKGARLNGARLRYVRAARAFMVNADLRGADLTGADLESAYLYSAKMGNATLRGAWLRGARLQNASLFGAEADGLTLATAELQGAWLQNATFRGANFMLAQMNQANLSESNLSGARFMAASLIGTSFKGANLSEARFAVPGQSDWWLSEFGEGEVRVRFTTMPPTKLRDAQFDGANLSGTDLRGIDLSAARGLTREQLSAARTDENTKLPDYLHKR